MKPKGSDSEQPPPCNNIVTDITDEEQQEVRRSCCDSNTCGENISNMRLKLQEAEHVLDTISNEALISRLPPADANNEKVEEFIESLSKLQKDADLIYDSYVRSRLELDAKLYKQWSSTISSRYNVLKDSRNEHFWYYVILNHEIISENITENDRRALRYLQDINYELATIDKPTLGNEENKQLVSVGSYRLSFQFRPNPYFHNSYLYKTYIMEENDHEELDYVSGTEIDWKSGKNLTIRYAKKKKKDGQVVTKKYVVDSFFNFFNPPVLPNDDDPYANDGTMVEEVEELIDADYELGEFIRNELIPRAFMHYIDLVKYEAQLVGDQTETNQQSNSEEDEESDDDEEEGQQTRHIGRTASQRRRRASSGTASSSKSAGRSEEKELNDEDEDEDEDEEDDENEPTRMPYPY